MTCTAWKVANRHSQYSHDENPALFRMLNPRVSCAGAVGSCRRLASTQDLIPGGRKASRLSTSGTELPGRSGFLSCHSSKMAFAKVLTCRVAYPGIPGPRCSACDWRTYGMERPGTLERTAFFWLGVPFGNSVRRLLLLSAEGGGNACSADALRARLQRALHG